MGLGGGIDRGLLVVLPIVENHVLDEHRAPGVKPDLEVEGGVLIGRAGRLEKADCVIDEELPFVQRRPNRRLRVDNLGHVGWDKQLTERNLCQLARENALLRFGPVEIELALHNLGVIFDCRIVQCLERGGHVEVIGLEDGDVAAPRRVQSHVHGGAVARVGLVDDAKARIGIEVFLDDVARGIGRSVVDANRLEVGEGLGAYRIEAFTQIALDVVDGHEHGYLGRLGR